MKNLYVAKTLFGLEDLLVDELKSFKCESVKKLNRAVQFETDLKGLYMANLRSRYALRILQPVIEFKAADTDELYKKAMLMDWQSYMTLDQTFAIDATTKSEAFTHSKYASLKLKDAIADHFREKTGDRPNVDPEFPDIRFNLHIWEDNITISLDASGESLHKRGYRPASARAPISEVLAAGMLGLAGWNGQTNFMDPMCGSGTLLLEALHMAANVPSQWLRRHYAFFEWANYDEELWEEVRRETWMLKKPVDVKFYASDLEPGTIRLLQDSIKRLPVRAEIQIEQQNFFEMVPPEGPFFIIMNPPYGERIKTEDIERFYSQIGDKLKLDFQGSSAWFISSNKDALKRFGLKPSKKFELFNGQLKCKFSGFELYSGSKKANKQTTD
jgi:putative N6-adenine-specific DNA methylase